MDPFRSVGAGDAPAVTSAPEAPAAPVDPNAGFGYAYTIVDGKRYAIGIGNDPNAAPAHAEAPKPAAAPAVESAPVQHVEADPVHDAATLSISIADAPIDRLEDLLQVIDNQIAAMTSQRAYLALRIGQRKAAERNKAEPAGQDATAPGALLVATFGGA